jgi:hypothetical protein
MNERRLKKLEEAVEALTPKTKPSGHAVTVLNLDHLPVETRRQLLAEIHRQEQQQLLPAPEPGENVTVLNLDHLPAETRFQLLQEIRRQQQSPQLPPADSETVLQDATPQSDNPPQPQAPPAPNPEGEGFGKPPGHPPEGEREAGPQPEPGPVDPRKRIITTRETPPPDLPGTRPHPKPTKPFDLGSPNDTAQPEPPKTGRTPRVDMRGWRRISWPWALRGPGWW